MSHQFSEEKIFTVLYKSISHAIADMKDVRITWRYDDGFDYSNAMEYWEEHYLPYLADKYAVRLFFDYNGGAIIKIDGWEFDLRRVYEEVMKDSY